MARASSSLLSYYYFDYWKFFIVLIIVIIIFITIKIIDYNNYNCSVAIKLFAIVQVEYDKFQI